VVFPPLVEKEGKHGTFILTKRNTCRRDEEKQKSNINNDFEHPKTYKSQSSFGMRKQISTVFGN
jgi:hypothetical protein